MLRGHERGGEWALNATTHLFVFMKARRCGDTRIHVTATTQFQDDFYRSETFRHFCFFVFVFQSDATRWILLFLCFVGSFVLLFMRISTIESCAYDNDYDTAQRILASMVYPLSYQHHHHQQRQHQHQLRLHRMAI